MIQDIEISYQDHFHSQHIKQLETPLTDLLFNNYIQQNEVCSYNQVFSFENDDTTSNNFQLFQVGLFRIFLKY